MLKTSANFKCNFISRKTIINQSNRPSSYSLEKKLNGSIECCGRSFTAPHIHFSGHKDVPIDIDKVSLPFISKEDFHYFEQRLRVTFVDVSFHLFLFFSAPNKAINFQGVGQ